MYKRQRQIYDLSSIIIAGAGLISFGPARLLGLALAVPFWLASRRGRGGMGDAVLIAASGFLLGFLRGVAGLVLALVLYCLFYLAIAALHKIRRQERPPESYPFAPFLAAGFFTAVSYTHLEKLPRVAAHAGQPHQYALHPV